MPFPVVAAGADLGLQSGLSVQRTVIAAQTTPTTITAADAALHGIIALNTSTTSLAAIQFFKSASTTLGVSTPYVEFYVPAATSSSTIAMSALHYNLPAGLPFVGGMFVAASTAASTGPNVAASTVTLYTFYC